MVTERSAAMPPSESGMASCEMPSSVIERLRTVSGAVSWSSASAAAGRNCSAANCAVASTIIFCSSVGVRSNSPLPLLVPGRVPDPFPCTLANVRLARVTVRNPALLAS